MGNFTAAAPDTYFISIRGDGEDPLHTIVRSRDQLCRVLRISVFGHDGPLENSRDEEDARARETRVLGALVSDYAHEREDTTIIDVYRVKDEENLR